MMAKRKGEQEQGPKAARDSRAIARSGAGA